MSKLTSSEVVTVWEMRNSGAGIREIAAALGKTYTQIDYHLRKEYFQTRDRRRYRVVGDKAAPHPVKRVEAPEQLLAERDARSNEPRTLSQIMFGDPPFSQSALAKFSQRGAAAPTEGG